MNEQQIKKQLGVTAEEKSQLRTIFQQAKGNGAAVMDAGLFLKDRQLITARAYGDEEPIPLHRHNYIEMVYAIHGDVIHRIDGEELIQHEGDLLMMNQYVEHEVKLGKPGDLALFLIVCPEFFDIPFQMLQEPSEIRNFMVNFLRKNNPSAQYLLFQKRGQTDIRNLMDNLIVTTYRDDGNDSIISQYTMGLIFLHILGSSGNLIQNSSQNHKDVIVKETLKYIDTQYKNASLSQVAEDFHQSLSGLSKIIKQGTGCTFQELLMRKRFQKATKYLVETDLQVEEVAVSVGYENVSYFYRQFKKRYGMTPRQYRVVHSQSFGNRKSETFH